MAGRETVSELEQSVNLTKKIDSAGYSLKGYEGKSLDYLMNKDPVVRRYFENVSEEEKGRRRSILEDKVVNYHAKFETELHGLARKTAKGGAMSLAILNDVYTLMSSTASFLSAANLGWVLFGASTLAEAPALYRYVKKSKDWYGAIGHVLLKSARYLIPVVGPALEAGAFERMVKRRARKEAKYAFLKEMGVYEPVSKRMERTLRAPVGEAINYQPVAA